jgi:hypothetical protein
MKRITDPSFVYRNSAETDVAATFRRIRKEIERKLKAQQDNATEASDKVKPLIRAKVSHG